MKTIIVDPFKLPGLPEPDVKADIILCTHRHHDHNNVKPVMKKDSIVLEEFVGSRKIDEVNVKGVATFHDDVGGSARGRNSVYIIDLDGLSFCHLGDLGHDLTASQAKEVGEVDILLTPVGGYFTIDGATASEIMKKIKPKITVPMHYRVAGMPPVFGGVDEFLSGKTNVKKLEKSSFTVEKTSLPPKAIIMVLSAKLLSS